ATSPPLREDLSPWPPLWEHWQACSSARGWASCSRARRSTSSTARPTFVRSVLLHHRLATTEPISSCFCESAIRCSSPSARPPLRRRSPDLGATPTYRYQCSVRLGAMRGLPLIDIGDAMSLREACRSSRRRRSL